MSRRNRGVALLRAAAWAALLGLAACGASEGRRVVRINLDDSPPLVSSDADGRPEGFAVEVLEEVAAAEGWELDWRPCDWSRAVRDLEAGELDLVFPMLRTSERGERFDFSRNTTFLTWGRVFARPGVRIREVADLAGRTVVVIDGDFFGEELRILVEELGIPAELRAVANKTLMLEGVARGEFDAAALEGFVNLARIEEYGLELTPIVFAGAAPHLVSRKGTHADLLAAFDRRLEELQAEEGGAYDRAFERWFGVHRGFEYVPVRIWTIVAVVVVLLVLGVATIVLLAKVQERNSELIAEGLRNRAILENMPVMLNAIGEDGLFVLWNKECERVSGYSAEEIIGNPHALELLYPDPAYRAEVLAESKVRDYEYHGWVRHYVTKGGELRYLSTSSISKEFPVPGWKAWGIAVEVTERVLAEERLRASEERLRLITDNLPVLIAQLDAEAVFKYCNARAREWFALEGAQVVGKHASEVLGDTLWDEAREWTHRALAGEPVSFETRFLRPDGVRRDIAFMLVPERSAEGETLGVYVLLADISERKSAEFARRRLEEQLRHSQKMEAVGELASGVAHDFRNLLTVISAHIEHVRKEVASNEAVQRSLATVEEAVSQAALVTRSLLTFSKKLDTVMVPMNLCEAIEGTTKMVERTMPSSVDVQVAACCEPAPWIEADPTQIQQVLLNLVLNARDAMPDGGTLRISVRPHPEDAGSVQLVVADSGCGMSPAIRSRVFEPFFTTKADERGTGLGLATVHGIVENHGGTVDVESEPGQGSAFVITLPLTERRQLMRSREPRRLAPEGSGERILLAEKNHQVLQIVAATLKEFGFEVVKARDGDQLAERLESLHDRIRLLVVDVELPKRSALEVLRDLRARGERIPAVLLSTNTGAVVEDLLDEDTVLLAKPFQMTELAGVVYELLARDRTEPTREE